MAKPPIGDAKHAEIPTAQPATNVSVLYVSIVCVPLSDDIILLSIRATIHEM